ncbi:FkbM family methyltransferase [Candidatus Pelagibacter sp. Uisw_134_02]|uniref:FkbM family methyltransferase n=1 Tax=Candidatus Pelagibacter sp. Uisw_134_02 TaxID=3230990 RepID=UPI0039EAE93F
MIIKYIKIIIKKILKKFNISIFTNIPKRRLLKFIELLKPHDLGYDLIRIGDGNEAGYLVPNILDKIKYCFSPGVGQSSQFESDLEKRGIKSYLADFSVDKVENLKISSFLKKNINSYNSKNTICINDWIEQNSSEYEENFLLEMDVDGSEFEILSSITEKNLKRFGILVIEFHYFELIAHEAFFKIYFPLIEKIRDSFEVSHLHPNNACPLIEASGVEFPSGLEVTFLNKKFVKEKKKIKSLPHKLDKKCIIGKDDIFLPSYWYN